MTAEREAMTLEQVRDYLRAKAIEGRLSDRYVGVLRKTAIACADAIDAHLSRAAETVYEAHAGGDDWCQVSKEEYEVTHPDDRRILYTHPPEPVDTKGHT